jgi:hypothetical protein
MGLTQPTGTSPYELMLEFVRAELNEDPYGFRFEKQEYRLRTRSGGTKSAVFLWNKQLLEDLRALASEKAEPEAARRLGEQLRRFLDELDWGGHEHVLEHKDAATRMLHVVIRSAAAELYALPWELVTLKDSGQHLAELQGCSLSYEWPREREVAARATASRGGRILFAWSAAGGWVPAEGHLRALQIASQEGDFPFDAQRDVLPRASLRTLEERLGDSRHPVSVLHVLCHGAPLGTGAANLYGLAWNTSGPSDGMEVVDGGRLGSLLASYADTLKMVVLCACHGGDSGDLASHLGGVAQALHRAGIEVVVASRLPLSSPGSVLMAETLYEKLLVESCSLEEALVASRRRLRVINSSFDWASLQLYAHRQEAADLRPVELRPYRGLLAFEPKHRRFFFGRATLEKELVERIQLAAQGKSPRFQVVAGASGAGKSSLVMAGLMPQLGEEWDWLVVRPGELVRAGVRHEGAGSLALQELRHRLHQLSSSVPMVGESTSQEELVGEVRHLTQPRPHRKLLLLVDHLEEVFTQLESEERQALVKGIWTLAEQPQLECVVVATLRVDYFGRCGEVSLDDKRRLDSIVYSSKYRMFVGQMGTEEVAEAVERPARKVGLELEPGLVHRICKDVGQELGALPLLEHALDLLWQRREGRWLKHKIYEEMGGVAGALTQTAEGLYEAMSERERPQARRLLVRLVAARDMGSSRAPRRVWVEEMRPQETAEREAFDGALEKLVISRLLVKGSSSEGDVESRGAWVQLAHETLLRRWSRLERWVEEDGERVRQVRQLEEWAEDWQAQRGSVDKGVSYLLAGDRLAYAKGLRSKLGGELSPRSRLLIEESQALEERHARQEKRRRLLATGVLLAVAVVVALIVAWLCRREQAQRTMFQGTARVLWAKHVPSGK